MPQPVAKASPHGALHFNSNHAPFENRPKLAQKAMVAISDWAHVELALKNLFIEMLGANPRPAATVFSALTGSATQAAALRAMADLMLDDELRSVFNAIMKLYKTVGLDRNKIAHGVWGYVEEIPDAIALIDPDSIVDHYIWSKDTQTKITLIRAGKQSPRKGLVENAWLYYERDFDAISRDTRGLNSLISAFGMILHIAPIDAAKHIMRHALFQDAPEADEEYRLLLDRLKTEPQIAEILVRQLKTQQNAQEDDSQSPDSISQG